MKVKKGMCGEEEMNYAGCITRPPQRALRFFPQYLITYQLGKMKSFWKTRWVISSGNKEIELAWNIRH